MFESIPTERKVVIEKSGALLKGHFLLTSGLHSEYYLQCALLLQYPQFSQIVAETIAGHFSSETISVVMSPAIGGIVIGHEIGRALGCRALFAERIDGKMTLRRGFAVGPGDRILLIEDVVTTAGSVKQLKEIVEQSKARVIGYASIFDRSNGGFTPVEEFFSWQKLNITTYLPDECPLCKDGSTPHKPGSRDAT